MAPPVEKLAEIAKGDFCFFGFKDGVKTLWFLKPPHVCMRLCYLVVMFIGSGAGMLSRSSSLAAFHAPVLDRYPVCLAILHRLSTISGLQFPHL